MKLKYCRPRSLTWWSGVGFIVMGGLLGISEGWDLGALARVLNAWTDGMGAGPLIATGLGLIGAREAIAQGQEP